MRRELLALSVLLENVKPHLDHVVLYDRGGVDVLCNLKEEFGEHGEILNAWLEVYDLPYLGAHLV